MSSQVESLSGGHAGLGGAGPRPGTPNQAANSRAAFSYRYGTGTQAPGCCWHFDFPPSGLIHRRT